MFTHSPSSSHVLPHSPSLAAAVKALVASLSISYFRCIEGVAFLIRFVPAAACHLSCSFVKLLPGNPAFPTAEPAKALAQITGLFSAFEKPYRACEEALAPSRIFVR